MSLTVEQERERSLDDRPQRMTLTRVEEGVGSFTLTADHTGFGLSKEYGVIPRAGDIVALYTHRGSMIRGLDLNGEPVFYKTEAELEEEHRQFVADLNKRRDDEFERGRAELDAAFAALPDVFKRRIEWFRSHNPRFRQDCEAYEMSACTDAVRIAEWAKEQPDPGEAINSFQEASYERQQEMLPTLDYGKHSGNSFAFAVRLAYHFVTEPENVYQEHGAMTPLVGCEEYGCVHPRDEVAAA